MILTSQRRWYLAVENMREHSHLLDDQVRGEFGYLDQESGHRFWPLEIGAVELFGPDFLQHFLGELGVVVFVSENVQELGHWLWQMLKV